MQIDYSAIGVFLNASLTPLPWWPKKPGLTFEPALKPRAGLEDRGHPQMVGSSECLAHLSQPALASHNIILFPRFKL